jgi:hypothetical protein
VGRPEDAATVDAGHGFEEQSLAQARTRSTLAVDEEVRQTGRLPGDDFFCQRYQVWYASVDCALRTKFQTSPGCLQCDQGRFNLSRHRTALYGIRFDLPLARE